LLAVIIRLANSFRNYGGNVTPAENEINVTGRISVHVRRAQLSKSGLTMCQADVTAHECNLFGEVVTHAKQKHRDWFLSGRRQNF
jgi:hypothetical protein